MTPTNEWSDDECGRSGATEGRGAAREGEGRDPWEHVRPPQYERPAA